MRTDRRSLLAMAVAFPLAGTAVAAYAAEEPDASSLWESLMAGPPGSAFAWWLQGTLYAHVDRLREFPVAGLHAIMICHASEAGAGRAMDMRTIGHFSDLDTGLPTARWRNPFTGRTQDIPAFFQEGPGRYVMVPGKDGPVLSLSTANSRTNRIVATAETSGGRAALTLIEGTLQGFPQIADGMLPPLDSPAITERQTRIQLIRPEGDDELLRGFFTQVYDALPPWLGFGDALGSGLVKGQMRRARIDEMVDARSWAYLRERVPSAFLGNGLALR